MIKRSEGMQREKKYKVIGLMSGTSLDGLDICYVVFQKKNKTWNYTIRHAQTIKYNTHLKKKLSKAVTLSAIELLQLDVQYGNYLGDQVNLFLRRHAIKHVDLIASHGHTVFHQPDKGISLQIGNGFHLMQKTKTRLINNFRSEDVAKGGQGAPLVPIGDALLFNEYAACLNLGGIANISFTEKKKRKAFDICFFNMGLNYLAAKLGKEYDKAGKMAAAGKLNKPLYNDLKRRYAQLKNFPALGFEIFEEKFLPLLSNSNISLQDRMHTCAILSAEMISRIIKERVSKGNILCTGGGTYNHYIMQLIAASIKSNQNLHIPQAQIIEYKEALIFAFLGLLRLRNEINCLSSVTGASADSSAGILYEP